jgi:hypothetical protein
MLKTHPRFIKTLEKWKKKCRHLNIKPLEQPEALTKAIRHKCLECSTLFRKRVDEFVIQKYVCPTCSVVKQHEVLSKTLTGVSKPRIWTEAAVRRALGSKYRIRVFSRTACQVEHLPCGTLKVGHIDNLMRFTGCKTCLGTAKKTKEMHNKELTALNRKIVCRNYRGAREKSHYQCLQCSFRWKGLPTNMLKRDRCYCPSCDPRYHKNTVKTITVKGTSLRLRGYEPFGLKYLLTRYRMDQIKSHLNGGAPHIQVNRRKHYPDFYIPHRNLLVEVKSLGTIGAQSKKMFKNAFQRLRTNRLKSLEQGYKYKVLVFDGSGNRVTMPKRWWELNTREMRDYFS